MKSKKYILICFISLVFVYSGLFLHESDNVNTYSNTNIFASQSPQLSSNNEIINSIFNDKVFEYYNLSYFSQIYDPSLQATYYGLYILNILGKLDQINQTEIINYIMSCYDVGSNKFMDTLSYRYLDTDFSQFYYPLSTVLEVNCYAILSLDILGSLDLINTQEMITFIWNCLNYISGGFIGQPYDPALDEGFKIATLDNTYFAVITLDLLMDDWTGHTAEKNDIVQFINDLQLASGGFRNDEDSSVDTIYPLFDPNLLSSYYAIKTLKVFGLEHSIRVSDFNQFLDSIYDPNDNFFRISLFDYNINYTNIVATALGLELSNITDFGNIDRNGVVDFILENRNSLGNWDQSTTVNHHELIDTFQIVRSLNNSKAIFQLALEKKSEIGNATQAYYQNNGYSHLSKDYTSMKLINTIISAFDSYDRVSDLYIQNLYIDIKNSYTESYTNCFTGYLDKNNLFDGLRSFPIEYYTSSNRNYIEEISQLNSHKSTFFALDSLKRMFKLDDFAFEFDLMELVNDIIATQFLNDSYYESFGAFTPLWPYEMDRSEYMNKKIFFEYSYYTIRCLELLTEQLGLANVSSLGFDILALYNYIERNVVETPTMLYFNPKYTTKIEKILENTYYMIYVLQTLDLFTKNSQKIKYFVESNLNYNNIKNIYYSYKISELLNLDIIIDTTLTQTLVQNIYSEQLKELYLTPNKDVVCQEAFSWICDMARNSEIGIEAQYSSAVPLGGINQMSVSLSNLVLRDFGTYISFKFESDQIGTYIFNKFQNNTYIADIPIPMSSEYYPEVEGLLCAYEGTQKKAELYISFSTTYTLHYSLFIDKNTNTSMVFFEVNSSIRANGKNYTLLSGKAFIQVFRNDIFYDEKYLSHQNFTEYSSFATTYELKDAGVYYFKIYLEDGFQTSTILIGNTTFHKSSNNDDDDDNDLRIDYKEDISMAIPLTSIFIGVPGIVILISSKKIKKAKKESKFK